MQIQLNSDLHIAGSSDLPSHVEKIVEHELRHVAAPITHVCQPSISRSMALQRNWRAA